MTTISEYNKAIQYYLDRLKDGPMDDKLIMNSINHRFKISAAIVRNKMIEDGVIKLSDGGYNRKRMRNVFIVSLVDESKVKFFEEPKVYEHKSIVIDTHWPEGWPKSHNNAFDWKKTAKGLFSKAELVSMQAKIKANQSFIQTTNVYSRA